MGAENRLKRWEIALALAVCLALGQALLLPESAVLNWWSVMFPGLGADGADVQAAAVEGGETAVRVRWWLLDLLAGLFGVGN